MPHANTSTLMGAFLLVAVAPVGVQGGSTSWKPLSIEVAGAHTFGRIVPTEDVGSRQLVQVRIDYDQPQTLLEERIRYRSVVENWDLRCGEGKGARGPTTYFEKTGGRGAKVIADFFPRESDYQESTVMHALCEHFGKGRQTN